MLDNLPRGTICIEDIEMGMSRYLQKVVTDRDIVVEIIAKGLPLDTVSVGDAMSFDLLTIPADRDIDDAFELMRAKAVRRVPVVDEDDVLVGVVSTDDLLGMVAKHLTQLYALVVRERQRETERRE